MWDRPPTATGAAPCDFFNVRKSFSYSTRKRCNALSPMSSCSTCKSCHCQAVPPPAMLRADCRGPMRHQGPGLELTRGGPEGSSIFFQMTDPLDLPPGITSGNAVLALHVRWHSSARPKRSSAATAPHQLQAQSHKRRCSLIARGEAACQALRVVLPLEAKDMGAPATSAASLARSCPTTKHA